MATRRYKQTRQRPVTEVAKPFPLRRALFFAACVLWVVACCLPVPVALYPTSEAEWSGVRWMGSELLADPPGVTAGWVVGKTAYWGKLGDDAPGALGVGLSVLLTLAYFANVGFGAALFLQNAPRAALSSRIFLMGSVVVGACAGVALPDFWRLPGYWVWMAALGLLAVAFTYCEDPTVRKPPAGSVFSIRNAYTGRMPLIIWLWLAMLLFWSGVSFWSSFHRQAVETEAVVSSDLLDNFVQDSAGLISQEARLRWSETLKAFESRTSSQIAVAIYPRLPREPIEDFCVDAAERSALGRKERDNGAVLFVFMAERRARLEVGYGLESVLTDLKARDILDRLLVPQAASGTVEAGMDAALQEILATAERESGSGNEHTAGALYWRQLQVALPRLARGTLPALGSTPMVARLAISFYGGLFASVLYGPIFSAGTRRSRRRQQNRPALGDAIAGTAIAVQVTAIVLAMTAGLIASVAGAVILAGGGGFGGGGALVQW